MIAFNVEAILLDIEGTTSSISFVHDVLFPFAAKHAERYLSERWNEPATAKARDLIARDAGAADYASWTAGLAESAGRAKLLEEIARLMRDDAKRTGLKELQGLIWNEGYKAGALQSHVYPDVPPALDAWKRSGRELFIYSSGSVAAQKTFFARTLAGDLLPLFSGHFDTTTGPKREVDSYRLIAQAIEADPGKILFVSDVPAELDAAAAAGMKTALSIRPGNAPVAIDVTHPRITSFTELDL